MRILHLLDTMSLAGTETHLLTLCRSLSALGVTCTIACRARTPLHRAVSEAGIDVLPLRARFLDPRGLLQLRREIRGTSSCVLHAHNGRTGLAAAVLSRLCNVPAVKTQHFLAPNWVSRRGISHAASGVVHGWANRQLAAQIAISEAVRTQMLVRREARSSRISIVLNGMEIAPMEHPVDRSTLPGIEAPGAATKVIFCASRLEREKDVPTLIAAMREVRERLADSICLIAGEGKMRPEIERQIRELHLNQAVRLLGFRPDIARLMSAADLFVLPCPVEAFGLVLLEAMAAGKAVVATRAGGPLEIVADGETGLLVPPGDAAAMGHAISALLVDDAQRERMGRAGRARVEARFSARRMAEETVSVYRQALAMPAHRRRPAMHFRVAVTEEA